eukprot:GAFH01002062.1.p2 GENE.GAFH01002062.1~~GAFH01002062.1.p2  ORF type:complete len:125 (-),score=16.09 GAFH01002062.1:556-930(-)
MDDRVPWASGQDHEVLAHVDKSRDRGLGQADQQQRGGEHAAHLVREGVVEQVQVVERPRAEESQEAGTLSQVQRSPSQGELAFPIDAHEERKGRRPRHLSRPSRGQVDVENHMGFQRCDGSQAI